MAKTPQAQLSPIKPELDDRPVKSRIALVALATDHTSERDFARICDPDQVAVYVPRIAFENPPTPESLRRTGPRLRQAAAQILPGEPVDVIAYSCTAASIVLGDDQVAQYLNEGKPDTPCVTPSSAAFDAFKALGVTRVSVLTPYTTTVSDELVSYFSANGLAVLNCACLGVSDDREMARISHDCIIEAAIAACDRQAEALFLSCTALRAAACVARIEDRLGIPVVTSNQATIWRCLNHVGITTPRPGLGRLFELKPQPQ